MRLLWRIVSRKDDVSSPVGDVNSSCNRLRPIQNTYITVISFSYITGLCLVRVNSGGGGYGCVDVKGKNVGGLHGNSGTHWASPGLTDA